jgi:hypothetical protein
VLRDLNKHNDSKKIKEILDSVTALYNMKVKEEQQQDKPGKGKHGKAALKQEAGKKDVKVQNQRLN